LERRLAPTRRVWLYRLFSLALPLGCAALVLEETGTGHQSPLARTFHLTFGTTFGIHEFIVLASPLVLTGAAVVVGQRANLWNVGGNGQLFAGAWAATAVAFASPEVPGWTLILLMLTASVVGGAAWILVPALLRAYFGLSEILSTLMLNFVAALATTYFAIGPWRDPQSSGGVLLSRPIAEAAWLPTFAISDWTISFGLLIALGCVATLAFFFRHSLFGYRTTIIGISERTGAYAGMNVKRIVVAVLLLSGAVAGLAGGVELLADVHSFSPSLSNNTGYIGIGIGVLAGGSFLAVGVLGSLVAAVLAMSESAQLVGVPPDSVFLVVGAMLLSTAVGEALSRYRLVRRESAALRSAVAETVAKPVRPGEIN
jgi:simple sugar transport system permease protein